MMFSHAAGAAVLNNTFTNVQTPFSEDGGYDGTQWIGSNTVDGVTQNGWSGHGAQGAEPALYSPLNGSSSAPAPTPVSTNPAPTGAIATSATASPGTGIEHAGDTVTLTLGFNGAVTVTGTPTLTLNDGGTATYVSGSGTSALTFRTTVASTDTNTSALAITAANLPSGASIKDASGVAADLSGAVKTFSGLQIDPILPAVTQVTASPGTGIEHVGDTVALTLGFNEAMTVSGTPTLTLNDGDSATYVSGSGTSALTFRTTVASTDTGTSALAITAANVPSGASIKDASGISADLSGAVKTFSGLQIDPTSPVTPTPAPSTAPTLSIADNTLSVTGRGGRVDLGLSVATTDPNDAVTVNIKGLPRYETITDNLDGRTFRGTDITLTAAPIAG
jgi:ribosomal protein L30E